VAFKLRDRILSWSIASTLLIVLVVLLLVDSVFGTTIRRTVEENLAMVRDTVEHLRSEGRRVFLDAEHFFDGYASNPAYALEVLRTATAAGAEVAQDNGAMDFIANATGSIFAQGWTPELQKLVGGRQDAAGLLQAVQAQYEKELNR